ncbi:MAG: hypothetical protein PHY54_20110 [Methylococcales bacterium]|nr:hypothetical protein [Methylococcales bacterium]
MNYQEAIVALQRDPNKSYIGFLLRSGECLGTYFFAYYLMDIPDIEEPDYISIQYEGGALFDHGFCGEEDFYSLDDLPDEAKTLCYKDADNLPCISGLLGEYALFTLFPDLPDPEEIWADKDKFDFFQLASWSMENDRCI